MTKDQGEKSGGISKVKLAVGAASLFLFIVGVKRTFRTDEGREILQDEIEWELQKERELRRSRSA